MQNGNSFVDKQLKKYKCALDEVWLIVANKLSKQRANYNVDKIICVDEFSSCILHIQDKINNY